MTVKTKGVKASLYLLNEELRDFVEQHQLQAERSGSEVTLPQLAIKYQVETYSEVTTYRRRPA